MSSTLSSYTKFPAYQANTAAFPAAAFSDFASSGASFLALKLKTEDKSAHNYWLLGGLVVLLHIAAVIGYINRDTSSHFVPTKHEVAIEFIKPEIIPPPPIEPPKPPPPPKVERLTPPRPAPALRMPVADQVVAPNDITVQENTEAPKSSGPVVATSDPVPPPPAAPKSEEPVTEATANAAYLNNPAPEYPPAASRMGWGGTVILRVRVLANGSAESVSVKKSSGRKVLDDSAQSAVKKWIFVPSKRGSTPVDGWATVPIIFNSEQ